LAIWAATGPAAVIRRASTCAASSAGADFAGAQREAPAEPHEVGILEHAEPDIVLDVRARGEGAGVAVQDGDPGRRRGGETGDGLIEQSERVRLERVQLGRAFSVINAIPSASRYWTSSASSKARAPLGPRTAVGGKHAAASLSELLVRSAKTCII
jgi:hypothetical protein